jgi:pimeloyl-ACP methyl ester carboxylesterase
MSTTSLTNPARPTSPPVATVADAKKAVAAPEPVRVRYQTIAIDHVDVFYREAGRPGAHPLVLLHGFPSSSHMFRNLIPALADRYRMIAPDYPAFGYSGMPQRDRFAYTFENYANIVGKLIEKLGHDRYALYVMDTVRRSATAWRRRIERVSAIIVRTAHTTRASSSSGSPSGLLEDRGRAAEAIRWLTTIEATKWQYERSQGRVTRQSRRLDDGSGSARSTRECGNPTRPVLRLPHQSCALPRVASLLS